jgi:sRNA-binding carbon storage regulator CsrA
MPLSGGGGIVMLVLERKVGQELVFSTGLRVTVHAIDGACVRLGLRYPEHSLDLTQPLDQLLWLEPAVAIRVSRRCRGRASIAIDAPQHVRVLRAELLEREPFLAGAK